MSSGLSARTDIGLTPSRGDLVRIAVTAIVLRGVLFVLATQIHGWTLSQFVLLRDGPSYVHWAAALLGNQSALDLFDRRVFIGYPLVIAGLAVTGVPIPIAAV